MPTASVIAGSTDAHQLGAAYMVLTDVEGETTPRKILRDERYVAARNALPVQLAQALVAIHEIDPAAVPGLVDTD